MNNHKDPVKAPVPLRATFDMLAVVVMVLFLISVVALWGVAMAKLFMWAF